jgi:hypothetical protein
MIDRRAEIDAVLGDRHVMRVVETGPMLHHEPFNRLAARAFPGHLRRRVGLKSPLQFQREFQGLAGYADPRIIFQIGRPIFACRP